jgi:hypothetical protein
MGNERNRNERGMRDRSVKKITLEELKRLVLDELGVNEGKSKSTDDVGPDKATSRKFADKVRRLRLEAEDLASEMWNRHKDVSPDAPQLMEAAVDALDAVMKSLRGNIDPMSEPSKM